MKQLTGSPKQIEWAEYIRDMYIVQFQSIVDGTRQPRLIRRFLRKTGLGDDYQEQLQDVIKYLSDEIDNSSWWIDYRDEGIYFLFDKATKK